MLKKLINEKKIEDGITVIPFINHKQWFGLVSLN